MSTRKIKDAKDLSSGELIYFKGHAKATYMSNGITVEDAIGAYGLVEHGTSDTTFSLTPNTFHVWGEVTELSLTIGAETGGVANEYVFQFTSGSEPTTLILPDTIKFNSHFTIKENTIYQISILNGLGTVMSWDI